MIEVKNLGKVYGKKDNVFVALDNINFSIPSGATVAIVGKSGSGKSTLMHIMSGLDRPTTGGVVIDGKELHKLKGKEMDHFRASGMGFIFQSFFVEANQTCFQNVMLPLEIKGTPMSKRKTAVTAALMQVELADKAAAKAGNLSGGQKQRLAIARAIVNRPQLIFADEPTGNLDSATGQKIMDLLFGLNKTLGATLVIVTHDHDLAARCQRQIVMKDGRVQGTSQVQKPKLRPITRRTGRKVI